MGTEASARARGEAGIFLTIVIACDKREAFAQGSEAIHYAVPEMDCFVATLPCANASRLSQAMKETIYRRR